MWQTRPKRRAQRTDAAVTVSSYGKSEYWQSFAIYFGLMQPPTSIGASQTGGYR